jgi:hypothetical protein
LIGASVDVAAYYPDSSTLFQDGGTKTVSGSIEYPGGTFSSYNSSWQVDITDTQLIVTKTTASGFPFQPASFNGFVLTILSGPALVSASADAASNFSPVGISIVGNKLFLNFQGVSADNAVFPVSSIININSGASGVPEPATWITVLTSGLGLLGFGRLRNRRKA